MSALQRHYSELLVRDPLPGSRVVLKGYENRGPGVVIRRDEKHGYEVNWLNRDFGVGLYLFGELEVIE